MPVGAFAPADVVDLYLHRGAFETVLADEGQEQVTPRWCSHTARGQEFWLILSQWIWNLRLELWHALHPTPMRTTVFASALPAEPVQPVEPAQPAESRSYGPRQFARPSFTGGFAESAFSLKKGSLLVRMWEAESYSLIGSGPQRSK